MIFCESLCNSSKTWRPRNEKYINIISDVLYMYRNYHQYDVPAGAKNPKEQCRGLVSKAELPIHTWT